MITVHAHRGSLFTCCPLSTTPVQARPIPPGLTDGLWTLLCRRELGSGDICFNNGESRSEIRLKRRIMRYDCDVSTWSDDLGSWVINDQAGHTPACSTDKSYPQLFNSCLHQRGTAHSCLTPVSNSDNENTYSSVTPAANTKRDYPEQTPTSNTERKSNIFRFYSQITRPLKSYIFS